MKIGIFGGTFNPIHIGHMIIANYTLHEFNLDQIYFVPTYESVYKDHNIELKHRINIIKSAIKHNKKFILNDIELKNKKISYTYNTLKKICTPDNEYYIIIGNEWLKDFNKWYNYKKIFKYASLIIAQRTDKKVRTPLYLNKYKKKILFLKNPVIEISSTLVKKFINKGLDIKYLLPEKVYKYIQKHNLYR